MAVIKILPVLCIVLIFNSAERIQLGKHKQEKRGLNLIGKFSTPGVFYEHFVKPGVPLLFKAVLDQPLVTFPAYENWTDNYLRDNFGDEVFNVESQKKENRNKQPVKMEFSEFLSDYKYKPLYLVDSIKDEMREDLVLPSTLQCGGFEKSITDIVLWFSSGGTSSVLHNDPLDNFLCILDGSKDFVFIDKQYKAEVESYGWNREGSYSTVDVDNIDSNRFSTLLSLPWVRGHAEKGDCIFIPYGWYHQIRSEGRRNMAVNYWLTHLWWFNHPSCKNYLKFNITEPLNKYPQASTNEIIRFRMLEPYKDLDFITKEQFLQPNVNKAERLKLFNEINLDRDDILTWEELYHFNIDDVVLKYQNVLALDFVRETEDDFEKIMVQEIENDSFSKKSQTRDEL